MKKPTHIKTNPLITIMYVLGSFFVMSLTSAIVFYVAYRLVRSGAIVLTDQTTSDSRAILVFIIFGLASVGIGCIFSFITSKIAMRPINRLVNGMNRLSHGDYSARVKLPGMKRFDSRVEDSFNKLAEELENTEMLRSDFVNNFSHEFKTPIVSILGFAQLLNLNKNMDEEERARYLKIIEEEATRLSHMATSVLDMTKVENTNILTDVTEFNLSEQIRESVLILENKWTEKNLDLSLDFDEYDIHANYELLKQVWINLIDNAVKFSPEGGKLSVDIVENGGKLAISVSNQGEPISDEDVSRIFNKFYQVDTSHSGEGTGIGLAVVKKIVTLHRGDISVDCHDGTTTFSVTLNK